MTSLNEAIFNAKTVYLKSRETEKEKRKCRPITKKGFVQYFNELFDVYDYGRPPIVKKDTIYKVSGLLKILRNNSFSDRDIYEMLDKIFKKWYELKDNNIVTLNRKNYVLDSKPNLIDIIVCRDSILDYIYSEQENIDETEGKSLLELWDEG